jgi:S-(hydroxymethyl)glutathione dehydrogenase / alcohol dehydrogenase
MKNIYPIYFKGLVLEGKKKINLRQIMFDGPLKQNQVLIKLSYSGICGKQVEEYNFKMGKDKFIPHLLGHEGSGIVLDIGNNVKHVKKNDHVVLHWMQNKNGRDAETALYRYKNKQKLINSGRITTFSEYSVVSSNRVTKISKDENFKIAALMGCCITTGIGTVLNQSKVKKNEKILIVGAGGVGLSIIVGLKIAKNENITVADIKNSNLKKAKTFKKIKTINPLQKNIKKENYDHIFITSGEKKAIKFGIDSSNPPSNIYFVGVPSPKTFIRISALDIHRKKNFFGSTGGEIEPSKDIQKYLDYYKKNKKIFNKVILSVSKITQVPKIIDKMSKGQINYGRNLIKF